MGNCASHRNPSGGDGTELAEIMQWLESVSNARNTVGKHILNEVEILHKHIDQISSENEILRERISQLETQDEWSRIDVLVKHYASARRSVTPVMSQGSDKKRKSIGYSVPLNVETAECTPAMSPLR